MKQGLFSPFTIKFRLLSWHGIGTSLFSFCNITQSLL